MSGYVARGIAFVLFLLVVVASLNLNNAEVGDVATWIILDVVGVVSAAVVIFYDGKGY